MITLSQGSWRLRATPRTSARYENASVRAYRATSWRSVSVRDSTFRSIRPAFRAYGGSIPAVSRKLAAKRIAQSSIPISYSTLDAQVLDMEDDRFDSVLSTYTLCTIPDPVAALREVRRVLKPGGPFLFVEHGRSPDGNVARHQDRMEPLERRLLGGCHVTRDIPALIRRRLVRHRRPRYLLRAGGAEVCRIHV